MIAINGGAAEVGGQAAAACDSSQGALLQGSGQAGTCQPLLKEVAIWVGQDTLNKLLIESGIALGIMAVASVGLGCGRPASGRWQRASSRNGSSPGCSRWPAASAAWTGSSRSTWPPSLPTPWPAAGTTRTPRSSI